MHGVFRLTLACASLATLAACGPTIRSDRDESIPIPRDATWAWAAPDTGARSHRGASPAGEIVQQRFQRAIEAAMLAKSYRLVADASQADFTLSVWGSEARGEGYPVRRGAAMVGVGFSSGYGYGPWGFGRFGFYRPWGFYQPWGWGFYGGPLYGGYMVPAYPVGYRAYSDRALVAVLRERASGAVAWSGRLGSDALYARDLTQARVQKLVDKLFADLR